MRILVCTNTSNFVGAVTLAGMPYRNLELYRALLDAAKATDEWVECEIRFLLRDIGVADSSWSGWPFISYLVSEHFDMKEAPLFLNALKGWVPDFIVVSNPYDLIRYGRPLASHWSAVLVYEIHDDEGRLVESVGGPTDAAHRARAIQRLASFRADGIVVLTEIERQTVLSWGVDPARVELIPMGTSLRVTEERTSNSDEPRFVFLGNLFHDPNASAACFLAEQVLPRLRRWGLCASIDVIGRCPEGLKSHLVQHEVNVLGPIPDLGPILSGYSLAMCPVWSGAGMKSKLLDYLASGLPVVASGQSVLELPEVLRPTIGVVAEQVDFAEGVIRLWKDVALRRRLSTLGRGIVEREFGWSALAMRSLAYLSRLPRLKDDKTDTSPSDDYACFDGSGRSLWENSVASVGAWDFPHMVDDATQLLTISPKAHQNAS